MYWNLFNVFVKVFIFEQIWICWVQNIHHSFVGWTGTELTCWQLSSSLRRIGTCAVIRQKPTAADGPGKPPEAKRRCTLRRGTAALRLQSCYSAKAPRWTPQTTMARGLNREAWPEIPSPWLWALGSVILHVNQSINALLAIDLQSCEAKNLDRMSLTSPGR